MAITILKNTLNEPQRPLPYILFTTGNHQVKMIYNGDYVHDKKVHQIKKELIVIHITPKHTLVDLQSSGNDTWIDISMYAKSLRTKDDIDELYRALCESVGSIEDVKSVYQTYFEQYIDTQ